MKKNHFLKIMLLPQASFWNKLPRNRGNALPERYTKTLKLYIYLWRPLQIEKPVVFTFFWSPTPFFQTELTRLESPWGDCTSSGISYLYDEFYTYTQRSCQKGCLLDTMAERCSCVTEIYTTFDAPKCSFLNSTQRKWSVPALHQPQAGGCGGWSTSGCFFPHITKAKTWTSIKKKNIRTNDELTV